MSAQRDILVQWLMELNNQWGVDFLELDEHNQCHLSTGEFELSLALGADEQTLCVWSPLVPAEPFLERRDLLERLLIMNYDEEALMGAALSIDEDEVFVQLNYRVPIKGLDAQVLSNLMCNFGETISKIKTLLVELHEQEVEAREPPGDASGYEQFTRV